MRKNKLAVLSAALVLCLSLTACTEAGSSEKKKSSDSDKTKISTVSTTEMAELNNTENNTAGFATSSTVAEMNTTEEPTTMEVVDLGPSVYTAELTYITLQVPDGFERGKEDSKGILITNESSGARILFECGNGSAEAHVDKSIQESPNQLTKEEWDIGGVHWIGYQTYSDCFVLETNVQDGYLMVIIDYGYLNELNNLMPYITFKN